MSMPPDREAPAEHPIEALLRRRWSPRSFTGAPVERAALDSLLEAARWAASSSNQQPWHLIVARKADEPEAFGKLLGVLAPGNQPWAGQASVLMLAVARMVNPANGNPNRHAFYDTGAAMAQMALQAAALGMQLHQMGGFDAAKAREVFGIREGYEPATAIALGPVGVAEALPEALAAREVAPRQRRPIGEWAFFGGWQV
ncbi:nitroreductase family protein [Belnapia moabensis]|uniref:nitroreductase family protein n=1 Tax=Belnapia moabensis TaxID=365533 RepID=UPI001B804C24|nr:nitroreductase family protein [Belnapia moabensis]